MPTLEPPNKQGLSPFGQAPAGNVNPHSFGQHSTNTFNSPLELAKERLTIADVWLRIGLPGNPPRPRHAVRSPLRQDKHPSFVIMPCGRRYYDHATHESGDVIDLIAAACNVSKSDAARKAIDLAGTGIEPRNSRARECIRKAPLPQPEQPTAAAKPPRFPNVHEPTYSDVLAIQRLRKLPVTAGLEIAIRRGLLKVASLFDYDTEERLGGHYHRAWIVTDSARKTLQGRRIDGEHWLVGKAKTPAGFGGGDSGAWIIGAANLGDARNVILCEGGADMLAAITCAWVTHGSEENINDIGFACITGANKKLNVEALALFQGKQVRIPYHNDLVKSGDDTGARKAKLWGDQLRVAGADVLYFDFDNLTQSDGSHAKDLNEICWFEWDDTDEGMLGRLPAAAAELVTFDEGGAR